MSQVNHSLSLTPPSKMEVAERWGLALVGLGLLAMLVAFLSLVRSPWITMGVGGTFFVFGGILLSINRERHQLLSLGLFLTGMISMAFLVVKVDVPQVVFLLIMGLMIGGAVTYFWFRFGRGPAGIRNDGNFHSQVRKPGGVLAWVLAITFTGFYVMLYWFPAELGGLVKATDPLYHALTGNHSWYPQNGKVVISNPWFLYGLIYTVLVLVMGFRFALKYRHNKYQLIRTGSVAFFQLIIAFALPHILEKLNTPQSQTFSQAVEAYNADIKEGKQPDIKMVLEKSPEVKSHYFSYFWPLDYDAVWPSYIEDNMGNGNLPKPGEEFKPWEHKAGYGSFGMFMVLFGLFMSTGGVIGLTYYFGKRWYCSWVCGCGGLAETAGDPFRHLSDKSLRAWRIERVLIHGVLALITVITLLLLINWKAQFLPYEIADGIRKGYGFVIGSTFAGVIGTGFYPILGSRAWCRFGCPQAAILGLVQKYFSRFRITTNGSQCISCGNCSTYCEMGIDVKHYAQRGENIVRASCVGCGVCSAVCPRGVLNLESGPKDQRYNGGNPIVIGDEDIRVRA